jgi:hypothetical protein
MTTSGSILDFDVQFVAPLVACAPIKLIAHITHCVRGINSFNVVQRMHKFGANFEVCFLNIRYKCKDDFSSINQLFIEAIT